MTHKYVVLQVPNPCVNIATVHSCELNQVNNKYIQYTVQVDLLVIQIFVNLL